MSDAENYWRKKIYVEQIVTQDGSVRLRLHRDQSTLKDNMTVAVYGLKELYHVKVKTELERIGGPNEPTAGARASRR
jgi:hypothetical protein